MKSHSVHWLRLAVDAPLRGGHAQVMTPLGRALIAGCCLGAAIALPGQAATLVAPDSEGTAIAQALPTPLPPLPADSGPAAPASGEQYLVLVNGSSDLLLQQVRQVEPGAFVNYVDGRSVIQAGRFSSYQNAQVRAGELSNFGIGAEVQATDYAGAPIAVAPPADYTLSYPAPGQPTQSFPNNTVAATPSSIEFGQAPPFQSASPSSTTGFPPPAPTSTNPGGVAPSSGNVAPPPVTTPEIVNARLASGYYVVIPGSASELQRIANQVVTLGAPNALVHTRTAPRGPHVAVGPYGDRGLAQEWNDYLQNSGIRGARLHFE